MTPARVRSPKVCPRDGVPLALHATCWACGAPAGPGHEVGELLLGLCQPCRAALARGRIGRPVEMATGERGVGELLTPREAGELLGVSGATVVRWGKCGHLKVVQLPGGRAPHGARFRVARHEVERVVRARAIAVDDE